MAETDYKTNPHWKFSSEVQFCSDDYCSCPCQGCPNFFQKIQPGSLADAAEPEVAEIAPNSSLQWGQHESTRAKKWADWPQFALCSVNLPKTPTNKTEIKKKEENWIFTTVVTKYENFYLSSFTWQIDGAVSLAQRIFGYTFISSKVSGVHSDNKQSHGRGEFFHVLKHLELISCNSNCE